MSRFAYVFSFDQSMAFRVRHQRQHSFPGRHLLLQNDAEATKQTNSVAQPYIASCSAVLKAIIVLQAKYGNVDSLEPNLVKLSFQPY